MCLNAFSRILVVVALCLILPPIVLKRKIDWLHIGTGIVLLALPTYLLGTLGFVVGLVLYYTIGGQLTTRVRNFFR